MFFLYLSNILRTLVEQLLLGIQDLWNGLLTILQLIMCVRQSDAASFCENYAKLYFDAKHVEKRIE